MSRESLSLDRSMLAMALVGYEIEKSKIEERIRGIRAQIGGKGTGKTPIGGAPEEEGAPVKRRKFSAAARKRMAAAQKKRWAEARKKQAGA
jgi:hypothetical protein